MLLLLFIASIFNILGGPSRNDVRVTGKKNEVSERQTGDIEDWSSSFCAERDQFQKTRQIIEDFLFVFKLNYAKERDRDRHRERGGRRQHLN